MNVAVEIEPAPLPPLKPQEIHHDSCRRLFCAVIQQALADAKDGAAGGADAYSRLRCISETRCELMRFAASPNRRSDFGTLLDMVGIDREGAARGLLALAAADWSYAPCKNVVLRHFVSPDGHAFYCDKPNPSVSYGAFLRANPVPDYANPRQW